MDESGEKNWSKRINWAACREPYKTELEALSTLWVEGQLTHGELALELWDMWSKKKFVETPTKTLAGVPLPDVQTQMEILVDAMRNAAMYPTTTPEERRELLENSLTLFGKGDGPQR